MKNVTPQAIETTAAAIRGGGLVVVPTPRWYMICCDAANAQACDRIFAAKSRPASKALLLSLPRPADVSDIFETTPEATVLIDAFWPGDLALRLNWKDPQTAERYAGAGTTAALAGCSSDTLGALARAFGSPIAATSANVSPRGDDYGLGPSITIGEVQQFAAQTSTTLAAMIDGGICPQGHHMTVVDCTRAGEPEIIRDGTTHPRALTAALGTNLADASRKPSDRWRTPA